MKEILIAGTVYEAVPVSTLAHDLFVQQVLTDSGLMETLSAGTTESEEARTERAKAFQRKVAETGVAPKLLAGLLQVKGVAWNTTDAAKAERSFSTTTSQHDKALLMLMLGEALANFFRSARPSSTTSH